MRNPQGRDFARPEAQAVDFSLFSLNIRKMECIYESVCQFSHILPGQVKILDDFFVFFDIFLSKSIAFFETMMYNIFWSKNLRCKCAIPMRGKGIGTYKVQKEDIFPYEKETHDRCI